MFISITRLRLRSWFYLPGFFLAAGKCVNQAQESAGFIEGATIMDKKLAFWTITTWRDVASMKAYRGKGVHRDVMPKFANWCDEGSVANWEKAEGSLPDSKEVFEQMVALGRPSPVKYPSVDQAAMRFPAPAPDPWRTRKFLATKTT